MTPETGQPEVKEERVEPEKPPRLTIEEAVKRFNELVRRLEEKRRPGDVAPFLGL